MNTIAFFADKNILAGFHAALSSLIINNKSNKPLEIILFGDKLSNKEKKEAEHTFNKLKKFNHTFKIKDAPEMKIPGANSLVGNFTTYGRLYLSELLPDVDLILYLDSDIIINLDIITVFDQMNSKHMLFVSGTGERSWSLDKDLYKKAGLKMDGLCFNAGILGINLKKWREQDGFKKCLSMIIKYPNQFLSADQALLNLTFHDDFHILTKNINIGAVFSNREELISGIYHFIGLPKPWHIFMNKYHQNYFLWEMYIKKSSMNFSIFNQFNFFIFLRQLNHYKKILFYKNAS